MLSKNITLDVWHHKHIRSNTEPGMYSFNTFADGCSTPSSIFLDTVLAAIIKACITVCIFLVPKRDKLCNCTESAKDTTSPHPHCEQFLLMIP
jgi:hypothetical protein